MYIIILTYTIFIILLLDINNLNILLYISCIERKMNDKLN